MNKQAGDVVPALPYLSAAETETAYATHMGPSMARLMAAIGTPIHYGIRESARVQDAYTGKWYWDCHRNGSVYNLGHRNPEVLAAVSEAMQNLEVGNLFLCSGYKAKAAEKLVASTDGALPGVTFAASGSEANEVAIRAARGFTRRRKLVSLKGSYHGSSCLAMAAGDSPELHERYLLNFPEFVKVPYNDVDALRTAVDDETSCVLLEASPAQLGFPVPEPGYFETVRSICDDKGAVFILDEVQTGLGSSGHFWLWQQQGVVPDILTTAKGLGGGIIPNAAVLMTPAIKDWFLDTEFPHMSTFGGNELGCVATATVCDITSRPEFSANVLRLIEQFREGFANAPFHVNQVGLCMGLLSESMNSYEMTRKLFAAGILVLPAHYDARAIEFRPILILDETDADEIIRTVRDVLG
ncbi:MAG: aminotransferase class III-fold pyridoxal phosphate-dependent enzyme [Woeseiaceae bacterium]